MRNRIKQFINIHPFTSLMITALIIRVIVVIFVPGFGSNHDFQQRSLVISFLEWLKRAIGVNGTQIDMFVSRLFYALISLISISMVYRIMDLLTNKKTAWLMALIPTFCCIMPSFGLVSNVSAFLGLPLVLYGSNVILRQEVLRQAQVTESVHRSSFLIAGINLGLGICVWYQSALFVLSVLVILGIKKNYKGMIMTLIGTLISVAVVWTIAFLANVNPWNYIVI